MLRKPKLLVVEDETAIRDGLVDVFVYHGYEVLAVADGLSGLEQALKSRYDLVLLDIMLPRLNGFDVCERLREAKPEQPIIMLTAKMNDEDIVQGLRLGADDYVGKPFSVEQLVLRVAAVLRRTHSHLGEAVAITLGDRLTVDTANLLGTFADNTTVSFTRREIEVLQYLYHHRVRAVPREELLAKVWGYDETLGVETRTVDIHIAKLRRKIEATPKTPDWLITVRGAGYRLLVD